MYCGYRYFFPDLNLAINLYSFYNVAVAQGCSWSTKLKCAAVVASCVSPCRNLEASDCISCLGDSYDTCKDCFKRLQQTQEQGTTLLQLPACIQNLQLLTTKLIALFLYETLNLYNI